MYLKSSILHRFNRHTSSSIPPKGLTIAEFGRGRRNSSKCLARGCNGDLPGEMRPCDESVFEFMEMKRESRWEGRERTPTGKVGGTRAICGNFRKPDTQDTQC